MEELRNILQHQKSSPIEISIKGQRIGRDNLTIIAGPCTIENYPDLKEIAVQLKARGIALFRGGTYKMRTSPYDFQGLGMEGLKIIKRVSDETGMISVSEIVSSEDVKAMSNHVDILQVGTRNMHNYRLLNHLGKISNPIILKRGMSSTIQEWLLAAEHILAGGNPNVILCERGIRTYENFTRNTLDISAVPLVKELSNLPIIVDPSHSSGRRFMIKSLSFAAIAAGADGLIIETHSRPDTAICDASQTIDFPVLDEILAGIPQLLPLWSKHR
ncbi:MAG: 3-deoxy-7-phosphoheptulonate synthase [Candidatus Cloacimonetes bacterium]|nr:3-deoxy-7-phosphoheptulonate synthase [Candidatus Cloacimonadota bacterium]